MDQDRIVGTAKNFGGKVEESFGSAIGDTMTQAEGIMNQAEGAAQNLYGQAKDVAADAGAAAQKAEDFIRSLIEEKPYTTALIALGLGWLIGRSGRRSYR